MADELKFNDIKIGDTIAGRYKLESIVNADNGEAAVFACDYDGWTCRAKVFYDDRLPNKDTIEKRRAISSTHVIKNMDQNVYNKHIYQIMPSFNGNIMSKPVNDKILLEIIIPGVVDALKDIHEQGVMHGCIKPGNIFYNPMGDDIVVGDYGVEYSHMGDCNKNIAMNYLPPEVQQGIYDAKSDYYSLGITLVQLITGKNPFADLNKKKMLKVASTLEIKLPPKVSPVLKKIIEGLTVKDYTTRWGAEEIEKTLAGEDVEVVDNFVYTPPESSYMLGGQKYTDLVSLINAVPSAWTEGTEALTDPLFTEFIEDVAEPLLDVVKALSEEPDKDKALFQLIYTVNPELPFCWKGMTFESLADFSQRFKNDDNKDPYMVVLSDGALYAFSGFKGVSDDVLSTVARVTDDAKSGKDANVVACKLEYLLSGQFTYDLEGIPFSDVNSFISYIKVEAMTVVDICTQFINDPRFFAWLEVLGYEEQIAQWRREVG